ncbi:hypothetical protein NLJ89_g8321 [Agrocybe chaxingu]|uniref:Uncharacterized protein n=1 Tax=Agrocybe chaxingu TaxID=84603 RepID=A0A9W8JVN2_9AGAR|nr:hypothetical protein NLJ89_g8321 [Agrocybe chaxingu]
MALSPSTANMKTSAQQYKRDETLRKYYNKNCEVLCVASRQRASRSRASETPEQTAIRKARHREAAAKYQAKNRKTLLFKEWLRRNEDRLVMEKKATEEGNVISAMWVSAMTARIERMGLEN